MNGFESRPMRGLEAAPCSDPRGNFPRLSRITTVSTAHSGANAASRSSLSITSMQPVS